MLTCAQELAAMLIEQGHKYDPVTLLTVYDDNCGVCRSSLMGALGFQFYNITHKIYFSREY